MTNTNNSSENIAAGSVEEGLDFACNLLSDALYAAAEKNPEKPLEFLRGITQYISFRYAGELRLAFEYLEDLGDEVAEEFKSSQFNPTGTWLLY